MHSTKTLSRSGLGGILCAGWDRTEFERRHLLAFADAYRTKVEHQVPFGPNIIQKLLNLFVYTRGFEPMFSPSNGEV
jgi:hypothetical protein